MEKVGIFQSVWSILLSIVSFVVVSYLLVHSVKVAHAGRAATVTTGVLALKCGHAGVGSTVPPVVVTCALGMACHGGKSRRCSCVPPHFH
jgi:hypothetical protein